MRLYFINVTLVFLWFFKISLFTTKIIFRYYNWLQRHLHKYPNKLVNAICGTSTLIFWCGNALFCFQSYSHIPFCCPYSLKSLSSSITLSLSLDVSFAESKVDLLNPIYSHSEFELWRCRHICFDFIFKWENVLGVCGRDVG